MTDRPSVEELLRRRIGLDPASTGPGLVARATRARMTALGLAESEVEHYRALVSRSEPEAQALIEEVVVPESWFFRDEHPFTLLAERAVVGWLREPAREPLRVLSVPSAGGEEPYSIAITLIDRGLPAKRCQIEAIDVSRSVLASARQAVYTENAFRSRDLSFRDRHFRLTPAGYELSAEIKEAVAFRQGNLLDPDLLADQPAFDVIFCRNLLIYFDDDARRRALVNLDRLLAPSGLLFVGHAEQIGLLSTQYRSISEAGTFAYERARPDSPPAVRTGRALSTLKREPARSPARIPKPITAPPALRPPPAPVPARAPSRPEALAGSLTEAARLADLGRHAEATDICEQEIRRCGPSAPALFLLGVIRQAAGDRDQAESFFEKAVYLDPRHDEALLALSLLAQRRGDLAASAGYRRRAERAFLEKHPR